MNIYVIYSPISLVTLDSAFSSFDCRFIWVSQVIGERVKLRAMWIKEDRKGSSKWPNIGKFHDPNQSTKRAQNAADGPNQPEPTTGWPWGPPWPVVGGTRLCVRHARLCVISSVFARLFVFWPFFAGVCLVILMCLDPIHTEYTPYSSPFSFLD